MPLSWNEIKDRARRFTKEWEAEASEDAEAKSFWDDFFQIFGVSRRRVATFEHKVKKIDGRDGYIDLLWKGVLLIEHKSRGKDLTRAHQQAKDYFPGLKDAELPRYILVSDFEKFRLYDLDGEHEDVEFELKDLPKHIRRFGFIAGYQSHSFKEQDPVNVQAAERMGKLHDALKASGFDGHALEVLLVRVLFCLFADDTGIFPRHAFHDVVSQRTNPDGSDLGGWLARIFQALNTPEDKRSTALDEQLRELPYVNGKLFEEALPLADFTSATRQLLLDASALDWSRISPAIFGSMFQSVMDKKARRNLGAHYTSETNILKLIGPLFLDELREELDKAGSNEKKLAQLHGRIAKLTFLDPACGCGNFLVIAYRELRLLELEILKRQFATQGSVLASVQDHVFLDVDQFYGIEIEEFPAQIAQVAMWLMDHQMNLLVAEQFGENIIRLPLKKSASIIHGNALRIDWNDVVPASKLSYIMGNPPFIGHTYQSAAQKADQLEVMREIKSRGVVDFVGNWFIKAVDLMRNNACISAAFVATSSIVQGEQTGMLWGLLLAKGVHINFAHQAFPWSNEASGQAAVHCVIVGFSLHPATPKRIYSLTDSGKHSDVRIVANISPYLIEAPNEIVVNRTSPLSKIPKMIWGNKPTDGGFLILSPEERAAFIAEDASTAKYIRRYMGGADFLYNNERYCLWLVDITPSELKSLPRILERVEAVRNFRLKSKAATTRDYAKFPSKFRQISQPDTDYLAVPEVSSERRQYIPVAKLKKDVIASNKLQLVPTATDLHFGILSSVMHMAWMRVVAGRLETRYSYSSSIVYNNFPWPEISDDKIREAIETAAQGVLDARALFPDSTLADLYDPNTMPPALTKAHQLLDRAVDAAYIAAEKFAGRKKPDFSTEASRVAFLFERYQALTSLLPAKAVKKKKSI